MSIDNSVIIIGPKGTEKIKKEKFFETLLDMGFNYAETSALIRNRIVSKEALFDLDEHKLNLLWTIGELEKNNILQKLEEIKYQKIEPYIIDLKDFGFSESEAKELINNKIVSQKQAKKLNKEKIQAMKFSNDELKKSILQIVTQNELKQIVPNDETQSNESDFASVLFELGFGNSEVNALCKNGVKSIDELLSLSDEMLDSFKSVGKTKKENILAQIEVIKKNRESKSLMLDYESITKSSELYNKMLNVIKSQRLKITETRYLTNNTINTLLDEDINYIYELYLLNEDNISSIKKYGSESSLIEIDKEKRFNIEKNIEYFIDNLEKDVVDDIVPNDYKQIKRWIYNNEKRKDKFINYLKMIDIGIDNLELSVRLLNGLSKVGINTKSELMLMEVSKFSEVDGIGKGSINELKSYQTSFFKNNYDELVKVCTSDKNYISYSEFKSRLLPELKAKGDKMYIQEILDTYSNFDSAEIIQYLEKLDNENLISKGRTIIKTFVPELRHCLNYLDGKFELIMSRRLMGKTLEEIGNELGITRERVRQLQVKAKNELLSKVEVKYGKNNLYESKYKYLLENYDLSYDLFNEIFDEPIYIYEASKMLCEQNDKSAFDTDVLEDLNISKELYKKILKYFDKSYFVSKGRRIKKKRNNLVLYYLEKLKNKDTRYSDFVTSYNEFIEKRFSEEYEKLCISETNERTVNNYLARSIYVLSKQWKNIRYYDIPAKDFTALFEELSFASHKNIQISTKVLFDANKKLMRDYDIRDEYELHNVLKKLFENHVYMPEEYLYLCDMDIVFDRMPGITFGEFDRKTYLVEKLQECSPVKHADLAKEVEKELGYGANVVAANWFNEINEYKKLINGLTVFDIDLPAMPEERIEKLASVCTEECYSREKFISMYKELFPDGKDDEVNPASAKKLGYNLYSKLLILDKYPSSKDYFVDLMSRDDVFDANKYYQNFGYNMAFDNLLFEAQQNYDLVGFAQRKFVTIGKLEKVGITKEKIREYLTLIKEIVPEGELFNAKILIDKYGVKSLFDDLGFDNYITNKIIQHSNDYSYSYCYGSTVFVKGKDISKQLFVEHLVKQVGEIEVDDLIDYVNKTFEMNMTRQSLLEQVSDCIYYNKIMDKLYKDFETFEKTLD